MSVSIFNKTDAGVGQHLQLQCGYSFATPVCNPFNVVEDDGNLTEILLSLSQLRDLLGDPRDTGAAIRDAVHLLSPYKLTGGSILFLVTQYSAGGSEIKELSMVTELLRNNIQLIGVEMQDPAIPYLNLQRIADLTDGSKFSSSSDPPAWRQANANAANRLQVVAPTPYRSRRQIVIVTKILSRCHLYLI